MNTFFRRTVYIILLVILVFQVGCTSPERQNITATFVSPTGVSFSPTQATETVPAAQTLSPVATVTLINPELETNTPAPTIQNTTPAQQGIGFGAFLDVQIPDKGMALMAAAGLNWDHIPFYWSTVEPQAGQINWGWVHGFENELLAANEHHINNIIYVNDTPYWALKPGYSCGAVAQDKFADMAHFLTEMVKRYSVAPFNVKYFELWSEPDVSGFLGCWGDPKDPKYYGGGYYGEMLKVAYPAIKAANPQAQVLFGGLLMGCHPDHIEYCVGDVAVNSSIAHFFEGALVDGAGPYFDGISFHAYDYYGLGLGQYSNSNWGSAWNTTGPVALVKAAYLRSLLAKYNLTDKYLMDTELALLCGRTGQEGPCVTEAHATTLSGYLVQSYAAGLADGLSTMIWFSAAGWRGTALLDPWLNPLPGYKAYQFTSERLSNATYVKPITGFSGIHGYEFSRDGNRIWVLWSVTSNNNSQTINLSQMPLAVYDMYGSLLPVGMLANVGLQPIFIEFSA